MNKKSNLVMAAFIAGLLSSATGVVRSGCFECPSDEIGGCSYRPQPFCLGGTNEPPDPRTGFQCFKYCLDQIGARFGPCVPCYEPSYKLCVEYPTNPALTYTEWYGRCTGVCICEGFAVYIRNQPYPNPSPLGVVSYDAGYCNPG